MKLFFFSIFQTTAVGIGNGSDLSMEIVQNNQIIYKLAFDDPGKNMLKPKSDTLKVIFDEEQKITIVGDTKFRFHCSNGVSFSHSHIFWLRIDLFAWVNLKLPVFL